MEVLDSLEEGGECGDLCSLQECFDRCDAEVLRGSNACSLSLGFEALKFQLKRLSARALKLSHHEEGGAIGIKHIAGREETVLSLRIILCMGDSNPSLETMFSEEGDETGSPHATNFSNPIFGFAASVPRADLKKREKTWGEFLDFLCDRFIARRIFLEYGNHHLQCFPLANLERHFPKLPKECVENLSLIHI